VLNQLRSSQILDFIRGESISHQIQLKLAGEFAEALPDRIAALQFLSSRDLS